MLVISVPSLAIGTLNVWSSMKVSKVLDHSCEQTDSEILSMES